MRHALYAGGVVVLAAALGLAQLTPPRATGAGAPAGEFSAARAFAQLRPLAAAPHPQGSAEHDRVRDRLLLRLRELGLESEVQHATAANGRIGLEWKGATPAGSVDNVVGRLPGTNHTRAVLLVAHYDSVPWGPGGSDDGAGVAAILETLRALRTGPPLRNDLVVLFSDGEEAGLLGAKAFVEGHRWARGVGVALNFEARGTGGPSLMFETSAGNGKLVRELAAAAPRPLASSLFYEIYRLLPNDTDLSVFKEAGFAGLNFAFIDGGTAYHTALDRIEALDPRSLQHHGSYALSLARRLGGIDLGDLRAPDAVYFNAVGSHLFVYSPAVAWVLASIVAVMLVAAVTAGLRRRRLTGKGLLRGALGLVVLLVAVPTVTALLWMAVRALHPDFAFMTSGDVYGAGHFVVGFVLFALAIGSGLIGRLRRRATMLDLWAGALLVWLLLLIAATALLPGASYLLAWPLLAATLALVGCVVLPADSRAAPAIALAGTVPGIVLMAPTVQLVFAGVTLALAAVPMVLVALLFGLLVPALDTLTAGGERRFAPLLGATSLLLLAGATLAARFDAQRPRPDNLFYALDADRGSATWGSTDPAPDEWTRPSLGERPAHGRLDVYLPTAPESSPLLPQSLLLRPAPIVALPAPTAELLASDLRDGVRTLRLRFASPRRAPLLAIHLDPAVTVESATLDGREVGGVPRPWALQYWAVPAAGFELTLRVRHAGPLRLQLLDESYGLPTPRARPSTTMPAPFFGYVPDATLVTRDVSF
ncbi:MAG TPA: M20/M25/M40 family metallo-hydrolase [Thermoanaerobaculia bacterium]|jgi:hypothetical protein|nr:M20/M25/M40 family metallo-hydrolase [Thermoanaerobaculia bacterium]